MEPDFYNSVNHIKEVTDFEICVKKSISNGFLDFEALKTLHKNQIIESQYGDRHLYRFERKKTEEEIARIEFVIFSSDSIGYIQWLKVNEYYQNQSIGTTVRKDVVNFLEKVSCVDCIYSKMSSKIASKIAKKQGFEPIEYSDLEAWAFKEV